MQYRVILRNLANTVGATVTCTLTTLPDTDHDGLPDDWETLYFGSVVGGAAGTDSDGDGLTNVQEYTAGTNPTNAASFLKVDLTPGASTTLKFGAEPNKTYTIQYATQVSGPWLPLASVLAKSTSRVETVEDPVSAGSRFYRVVTPAQP